MMFLDCPAYLDQDGALRCGLPAEVRCRFTMRSTDGPQESVMIRCPAGHYFCGAIESLTWDGKDKHDPGPAGLGSRAGRDSLQRSHDGRHGGDRSRAAAEVVAVPAVDAVPFDEERVSVWQRCSPDLVCGTGQRASPVGGAG